MGHISPIKSSFNKKYDQIKSILKILHIETLTVTLSWCHKMVRHLHCSPFRSYSFLQDIVSLFARFFCAFGLIHDHNEAMQLFNTILVFMSNYTLIRAQRIICCEEGSLLNTKVDLRRLQSSLLVACFWLNARIPLLFRSYRFVILYNFSGYHKVMVQS